MQKKELIIVFHVDIKKIGTVATRKKRTKTPTTFLSREDELLKHSK
jgi:hypothetical protein